jgi:transcriptional antiterminator NusG
MAIGLNDEFGYLDDDEFQTEAVEAPIIKGSNEKEDLVPETKEKTESEAAKEKLEEENKEPEKEYNSIIFVVKVTTNKEDKAFEMIADKVLKRKINIYALIRPHGLRGYLLIESPDRENAEEAVYNLPYVKGILPKQVTYDEVRQMLEPVASEIKIEKNDIVEIIGESFKNEKAKVVRFDKVKGDAVVLLLNAAVPMPVTVRLDNLRVIRREEMEE